MKPELIIITDLWGIEKSHWINYYLDNLKEVFNVKSYDSRELGELNEYLCNENEIHSKFIEHGIDIAVKYLLKTRLNTLTILAFSIGGTIAWKAALKGMKIDNLYLISSTRLRFELERPNCRINLFYGENDTNRPIPEWFEKIGLTYELFKNAGHQVYMSENIALGICEKIKTHYTGVYA